jgi:Fe-Mn family superoxide dismutase
VFTATALGQFGSGWGWLVKDASGKLSVAALPNQDTPLAQGFVPLLNVDVWEHAYYMKYQNRRAEYLTNWRSVSEWFEMRQ